MYCFDEPVVVHGIRRREESTMDDGYDEEDRELHEGLARRRGERTADLLMKWMMAMEDPGP